MPDFKWRTWAKSVAIVELIGLVFYSILEILGIVALTTFWIQNRVPPPLPAFTLLIINAVMLTVGFWIAILLLNGTKEGLEIDKAIKKCTLWRNITIVLVVLGCVGFGLQMEWVRLIIGLIVQIIFIVLVQNYITELKEESTQSPA